jgi:hypothetical protein
MIILKRILKDKNTTIQIGCNWIRIKDQQRNPVNSLINAYATRFLPLSTGLQAVRPSTETVLSQLHPSLCSQTSSLIISCNPLSVRLPTH